MIVALEVVTNKAVTGSKLRDNCKQWKSKGVPVTYFEKVVTMEKVRWYIYIFKTYKSGGPDLF